MGGMPEKTCGMQARRRKMAVKAVLTKAEFDQVPAGMKEHYKEAGETLVLDVVSVNGLELADNGSLKKALQTERTKRTETEKVLKDFQVKYGDLDPEAAKAALAKMDEIANWDPEKKGKEAREQFEKSIREKFEGDRKKIEDKFKTEIEVREGLIKELNGQLENHLISAEASKAFLEAGGRKEDVRIVLSIVKEAAKVKRLDDGRRIVRILDDYGQERIGTKPGSAEPMTISEFIGEIKANHGSLFESSGSSGAGSERRGSGQAGLRTIPASNLQAIGANLSDIASGKITVVDG